MPLRSSAAMGTEIFINSRNTFVSSGGSTLEPGSVRSDRPEDSYFSGICSLAYQFVQVPLCPEEADRLCNACKTTDEKTCRLDAARYRSAGLRVMQPATKPRSLAAEITARQRKRWPLRQAIKEKGCTDVTPDTGAARILFQSE